MTFLNPMILIGLAAASIPVILHLLNLRKLKSVEFSSLRFLKELQKTKIRRLKIKQLILLILRTLLIIFIVLAFARPTVESSLPFMSNYAKTSIVIILDNSFSMDISDEFGNRFNQSKNAAICILNSLKEGDEAAIISMTGDMNGFSRRFSTNLNLAKEEIGKLKIAGRTSNLWNSLRIAESIMEESLNLNKEIYIISDCQKNIFDSQAEDSTRFFEGGASVFFVTVGANAGVGFQNISVDSIHVVNRIFQVGKNAEVEAFIRNHSSNPVKGLVTSLYFNNERVAQRSLDLAENELKSIIISASPQKAGATDARIEIENDALDEDNKRFFGFVIPEKPNVVIIGSKDKVMYAAMALAPNKSGEESATVSKCLPNELAGLNLTNTDLLILAGGNFRESDYQRVVQYVNNGGSVFVFADNEAGNNDFRNFTEKLGFGNLKSIDYDINRQGEFISVDKIHPLFEGVFKGVTDSRTIVESPKIRKALVCSQGQTLIEIPGGSFISESRIGNGIALYCAVQPDLNWSSFPVTGIFPVILFRSVFYLAAREQLGFDVKAGNPLMLSLPKRYISGSSFKIFDPNKVEFFKQAAIMPSGLLLPFENPDRLGNYSVFAPDSQPVTVFSVNFDPSESDISSLSKSDIGKITDKKLKSSAKYEFIDDAQNIPLSIVRARTGTELWQLFLILAIAAAVTEILVAQSGKKDKEQAFVS